MFVDTRCKTLKIYFCFNIVRSASFSMGGGQSMGENVASYSIFDANGGRGAK